MVEAILCKTIITKHITREVGGRAGGRAGRRAGGQGYVVHTPSLIPSSFLYTHHVWAYGNLLYSVPDDASKNGGLSSPKPPGGIWELPVTNWTSLANSSGLNSSTAIQNHWTDCKKSEV